MGGTIVIPPIKIPHPHHANKKTDNKTHLLLKMGQAMVES